MSQNDMSIANQSGAAFRADLNTALQALVSNSSGTTAPSTTYAYQFWVDTSGGSPLLKMRNAANSAWITMAQVDLTNFGYLPLATGGTLAAALLFSNTDYMKLPVGTAAQRPGSPAVGMLRYNSDSGAIEGYVAPGIWVPFGAGSAAYGVLGAETLVTNRVMTASDDGAIFLANTATAAIQITLPPNKANSKFIVKDIGLNALVNNITIVRNAAETIEGAAATLTLQANGGSWAFMSDASFNFWIVK